MTLIVFGNNYLVMREIFIRQPWIEWKIKIEIWDVRQKSFSLPHENINYRRSSENESDKFELQNRSLAFAIPQRPHQQQIMMET